MGLFGWGKKNKKVDGNFPPLNLANLQVDIHSHLIPGIDDGARNMDESIAMLAKFESLGYRKVVTTPHIMSDYFKNTPETILGGLENVRELAARLGLKIQIDAAAEYYYDESLMSRLKREEKLLTFDDNYLLFEYSMHSEPDNTEALIFEMTTRNYKPVIAHFERYPYYHGSVDKAKELRENGVFVQLNMNSLTGHYGPAIKKQAELMVDQNVIDFVGSDCHRMDHLINIEKHLTFEYFHKLESLSLVNRSLK